MDFRIPGDPRTRQGPLPGAHSLLKTIDLPARQMPPPRATPTAWPGRTSLAGRIGGRYPTSLKLLLFYDYEYYYYHQINEVG